jgi:LPS export ABC transporter protein LptC
MNIINKFRSPLLLFAFCFIFSSCEEKLKPTVRTDIKSDEVPTQESWNNIITFSEAGITTATLRTGHSRYFSNKAEYFLDDGVKVDFFDKFGKHTSILTSERAVIDNKTKNMEAIGNVIVISDSGTVVKTESMKWINDTKRIIGDQFVTITSPRESIQGYGFESDQNLKDYTIKKVSGQVTSNNAYK